MSEVECPQCRTMIPLVRNHQRAQGTCGVCGRVVFGAIGGTMYALRPEPATPAPIHKEYWDMSLDALTEQLYEDLPSDAIGAHYVAFEGDTATARQKMIEAFYRADRQASVSRHALRRGMGRERRGITMRDWEPEDIVMILAVSIGFLLLGVVPVILAVCGPHGCLGGG